MQNISITSGPEQSNFLPSKSLQSSRCLPQLPPRLPHLVVKAKRPAAGFEGGHQTFQHLVALRQVYQHHASVYQVKGVLGQWVTRNIVMPYFELLDSPPSQELCINVGRDHPTGRAYTLAEPECD